MVTKVGQGLKVKVTLMHTIGPFAIRCTAQICSGPKGYGWERAHRKCPEENPPRDLNFENLPLNVCQCHKSR